MSDTFRVSMPLGGKFLLLHWWTYNERGHLILAPTRQSLYTTARRVFEEHSDAVIKAYCPIEVVGPSKRLIQLAAESHYREQVGQFHHEVVTRMRSLLEAGMPLPPPFKVCTEYAPDDEETEEEDRTKDAWSVRTHYGCENCLETIQLDGLTREELYRRYFVGWRKLEPREEVEDKREPSRAPPAKDDEELWFACADFGHHSYGISLDKVNMEEADAYKPASEQVMFFFRRGDDYDPSSLQAVLDELKSSRAARREAIEQARIQKRDREERDRLERTISFFRDFHG